MKEQVFAVDGIMCPKCVKKITEVLLKQDGINQVGVSDDYQSVTILFDEQRIIADTIKDSIETIEGKAFKIIT
ncbi:heavy-metal-associated domain-containing protein [Acetobacterium wieringae]|uniref:Heavy-metal-associated domain protein n=1 Tax=Acetobacterium wieringae TaxID=52694 RepID=A0A1F2PE51_9FIRM|nr:heavy-metal-associated domain-containing protein [Acetobacterium wieringae]OFV69315.1 heavy-metal-associated domain protein [Acetobacterium wieringae]